MATVAKTTLAAAMASAFAEIEGATKDNVNPHFKSKYADLGSVIAAIKPALVKHGLFFIQRPEPSEDGVIVATILRFGATGEEMDLGKLYVPANKRDAQGFGSALTYARRYALMTAFGVPAEDDDGNAASRSSAPANDARNGNSRQTDDPFPPGPARNVTDLKAKVRELWREVEGCGDPDELDALIKTKENVQLVTQCVKALPKWWEGTTKGDEQHEGLESVISRKQSELAMAAMNAG